MSEAQYFGDGQVKLQEVVPALVEVAVESKLLVKLEETQQRIFLGERESADKKPTVYTQLLNLRLLCIIYRSQKRSKSQSE